MMNLLASVFAGIGMLFGGMFGGHMGMPPMASTTPPDHMASTTGAFGGIRSSGITGKITSISGTTFTMNARGAMGAATTTYTVDASSAKIFKFGGMMGMAGMRMGSSTPMNGMPGMRMGSSTPHMMGSSTPMSVSDLAVGDNVMVIGKTSGTTITAETVVYGIMAMMQNARTGEYMGGHMQPQMGGNTGGGSAPMAPASTGN